MKDVNKNFRFSVPVGNLLDGITDKYFGGKGHSIVVTAALLLLHGLNEKEREEWLMKAASLRAASDDTILQEIQRSISLNGNLVSGEPFIGAVAGRITPDPRREVAAKPITKKRPTGK